MAIVIWRLWHEIRAVMSHEVWDMTASVDLTTVIAKIPRLVRARQKHGLLRDISIKR